MSEDFGAFLIGMIFAFTIFFAIWGISRPEIEVKELYRFCLVKDIPLEECVIPKRPYDNVKIKDTQND